MLTWIKFGGIIGLVVFIFYVGGIIEVSRKIPQQTPLHFSSAPISSKVEDQPKQHYIYFDEPKTEKKEYKITVFRGNKRSTINIRK
jgi:hypothetical protein